MAEETMEVPSEEEVEETPETPSEQPEEGEEAPEETTEETPEAPEAEAVEPELYELPDGRKVDADTLQKEWKDNFYPEFTRKSQKLAELEKGKTTEEVNPYADPEYIPKSYEEIIQAAKTEALKEIEGRQRAEAEQRQALETEVGNQLTELKKADPSLNENTLFQHANKYGFRDLKVAYQNMKDMNLLAKNVQQRTAKNIQKRAAEPISTNPGQSSGVEQDPSMFENARDFLRSLS